jgi:hypothetical protein
MIEPRHWKVRAIAAVLLFSFSCASVADCDPMTVRQMLVDGGWSFEAETNESGEGVFSITSDGIALQAVIERDGDSQFLAFYIDNQLSRQESLEWINEASSRLAYAQMWLDEDEDVAVMYSVAEWSNTCPANLSDNIKLFVSVFRQVGELHPKAQL